MIVRDATLSHTDEAANRCALALLAGDRGGVSKVDEFLATLMHNGQDRSRLDRLWYVHCYTQLLSQWPSV